MSPTDATQNPSVKVHMKEIMDMRTAEKINEPATNNAHAAGSAEASGATTTTARNATDDGLTSSSFAARDTPQGADGTMYAKRTFHNCVTMRVETESQRDLQQSLNNNHMADCV